jgi:hypothetical protein
VLAWVVLRVLVGLESGSPDILLPTSIFLMAGVAGIAVVDLYVARERVFLANVGIGRRSVVLVSLLVSGSLELLSALVVGLGAAGG